ncbi:hypothetical protein VTL71DRAFT_13608 [Oculimacula yallundae]|uniref:GAF domain-containing protein n=1 Tax=Oculimacula yallundae TaxID=86028 RepID=A0ABR4CKU8_9HELO
MRAAVSLEAEGKRSGPIYVLSLSWKHRTGLIIAVSLSLIKASFELFLLAREIHGQYPARLRLGAVHRSVVPLATAWNLVKMEQYPYNTGMAERESNTSNFPYTPRQESIATRPSQSNSETRPFINHGITDFLGHLGEYSEGVRIREEEEKEEQERIRKLEKELAKAQAKKDKKGIAVWVKDKIRKRSKPESEQVPVQEEAEWYEEPLDEKFPEDQEPMAENDLVGIPPSPYARPLEYSMSPRQEVSIKSSEVDNQSETEILGGITIARHRGETHRALFCPLEGEETVTSLKGTSTGGNAVQGMSSNTDFVDNQEPGGPYNFSNHNNSLGIGERRGAEGFTDARKNVEVRSGQMFSSSAAHLATPQSTPYYANYAEQLHMEKRESLVEYLSQTVADRPFWRNYLESYSQGEYNMIHPPAPPRLSASYQYLPAPLPPSETTRIEMSREYDILWPQWVQEQSSDLIRNTMNKFDTRCASLSFFDETNEIFKAENGYDHSHLNRDISLGAHCLLSKDVLVILDTKEDWRFIKNPLVVGFPKIRFWAGAPMMAPCGEVLGVFAIFSSRPRTSFTPSARRELAEFTSLVMQDLMTQVEGLNDAFRLTPLLDRDTFIEIPTPLKAVKSVTKSSSIDPDLVPQGLIVPVDKTPKPQPSRVFHSSASRDPLLHPSEQTPPCSAESSHGFFENPSSLIAQDGHISGESGMSQGMSLNNSMASYPSGLCRAWTPRPFSSSQLTSIGGDPPNTPAGSVTEVDLSTALNFDVGWEEFVKLTDEECAEPYEETEPVPPKAIGRNNVGHLVRIGQLESIASQADSHQILGADGIEITAGDIHQMSGGHGHDGVLNHQRSFNPRAPGATTSQTSTAKTTAGVLNGPLPKGVSRRTSTSKGLDKADSSPLIDLGMSPESDGATFRANGQGATLNKQPSFLRGNRPPSIAPTVASVWNVTSQELYGAEIGCIRYCKNLDYDLIYVVEIKPMRQFMTAEEIMAPGGLRKRLWVLHGDQQYMQINSVTHLRALRSRGGEFWSNPVDADRDNGGFQSGRLIGIYSDDGGPMKKRSSGLVLGALRKSRRTASGETLSSSFDFEELSILGQSLVSILRPSVDRPQPPPNIERGQSTNGTKPSDLKKSSSRSLRNQPY